MATTTCHSTKLLRSLCSACKGVNRDTKCIMLPINPNAITTNEIQQEINKRLNYIKQPYYSYIDYVSPKYSSASHYERPYYYMNTETQETQPRSVASTTNENIHDICFWPTKNFAPKKDPSNNFTPKKDPPGAGAEPIPHVIPQPGSIRGGWGRQPVLAECTCQSELHQTRPGLRSEGQ